MIKVINGRKYSPTATKRNVSLGKVSPSPKHHTGHAATLALKETHSTTTHIPTGTLSPRTFREKAHDIHTTPEASQTLLKKSSLKHVNSDHHEKLHTPTFQTEPSKSALSNYPS
jgi:hypothetical protein